MHEGAVGAEGDGEGFGELAFGAVLEADGARAVEEGDVLQAHEGFVDVEVAPERGAPSPALGGRFGARLRRGARRWHIRFPWLAFLSGLWDTTSTGRQPSASNQYVSRKREVGKLDRGNPRKMVRPGPLPFIGRYP